MKAARFVLTLVAMALTIAAAVCAVVVYWDKVMEFVNYAKEKLATVKAPAACAECSEYDDFVE